MVLPCFWVLLVFLLAEVEDLVRQSQTELLSSPGECHGDDGNDEIPVERGYLATGALS